MTREQQIFVHVERMVSIARFIVIHISIPIYINTFNKTTRRRAKGNKAMKEQEKEEIEDMGLISNKPNHQMDLMIISKEPYSSLKENHVVQKEPIIDVPHIYFVFGGSKMETQGLHSATIDSTIEASKVRLRTNTKSSCQKKQCVNLEEKIA